MKCDQKKPGNSQKRCLCLASVCVFLLALAGTTGCDTVSAVPGVGKAAQVSSVNRIDPTPLR